MKKNYGKKLIIIASVSAVLLALLIICSRYSFSVCTEYTCTSYDVSRRYEDPIIISDEHVEYGYDREGRLESKSYYSEGQLIESFSYEVSYNEDHTIALLYYGDPEKSDRKPVGRSLEEYDHHHHGSRREYPTEMMEKMHGSNAFYEEVRSE